MGIKAIYVDTETGATYDRDPRKKSKEPNAQNAPAQRREYTAAEKAAYNIGLGSSLSRTPEGREKHVMAMFGDNPAALESYQCGRRKGVEQKKKYLEKQRSARKNNGKGKK